MSVGQSLRSRLYRLNDTLRNAKENSRFYARHLPDLNTLRLKSINEIERIPFTEERHLSAGIEDFLCVPPGEISRIVSLFTSGSTGHPKRICFTGEDLENIAGYFSFGMSQIVAPGKKVLICLPGKSEYGVSYLLSLGIKKFGGLPEIYGIISDPNHAAGYVNEFRPDCIVGMPVQVLAMAECHQLGYRGHGPSTVLLTADYAAESLKLRIREAWDCRVLNHYGSTEMGYGGALECKFQKGLHLREMDLYFEIVDPHSGKSLSRREEGELVFTTLSRRGMPLIRYRTGDFTRLLPGRCACGQKLSRVSPPWRFNEGMFFLHDQGIKMSELDEILFSDRHVMDYSVSVLKMDSNETTLKLTLWMDGKSDRLDSKTRKAIASVLPCGTGADFAIAKPSDISPGLRGKRFGFLPEP
ncbi:MAG: AMP-binding protein [Synergistaceae bacterium]|nr:AMP-binding protein [Synergistaceae bacterium]